MSDEAVRQHYFPPYKVLCFLRFSWCVRKITLPVLKIHKHVYSNCAFHSTFSYKELYVLLSIHFLNTKFIF